MPENGTYSVDDMTAEIADWREHHMIQSYVKEIDNHIDEMKFYEDSCTRG